MRTDPRSIDELIEEAQRAVLKRIIVLAPQSQHGESARNLAEAFVLLQSNRPGEVASASPDASDPSAGADDAQPVT